MTPLIKAIAHRERFPNQLSSQFGQKFPILGRENLMTPLIKAIAHRERFPNPHIEVTFEAKSARNRSISVHIPEILIRIGTEGGLSIRSRIPIHSKSE